eukprot:CAMPEP_0114133160 /NCGR_PEP_ID=MMETSP0043_2-20121206/13478_1 /TAXON_ID=464988 /ORGANISM="Hemiselmis andersenii, Strain CCMP644" /LENGTH=363 /DNA_ID=CAMNT_0001226719 /DNA_START=267 /DNA_END=1355 /DNA_ORIENTATION=-
MSAGDAAFREGQTKLKGQDVNGALECFKKAAAAYRDSGEENKLKLIESMVARVQDQLAGGKSKEASTAKATPAPSKAQAPKLAPPKKASPFDYSRFDQIVDSDDDDDAGAVAPSQPPPGFPGILPGQPPPNIPAMPPKLMQAIAMAEEIKARGGSKEELCVAEELAAKAMDEASPEVKKGILDTLTKAGVKMPDVPAGAAGYDEAQDDATVDAQMSKVEAMKASMQSDLDKLKASMRQIRENESKLSSISSPEEMIAFLKTNGASNDEIESLLKASAEGNQAQYDKELKRIMERTMVGSDGLPMAEMLKKVEKISEVTDKVKEEMVQGLGQIGGGSEGTRGKQASLSSAGGTNSPKVAADAAN